MDVSKLNIGLIGPLPPPSGGMANQMNQLAQLLQQDGAKVEIVQVNAPYRPVWIGKIQGARAIFRLLFYIVSLWKAAGRVTLFHVMANSGWSWHLFAAPAICVAYLRGVPVVLHYHGGEAEAFFQRSFRWVNMSLRLVRKVIVPSGFLVNVFQVHNIKAEIVPNVLDLSRYEATDYEKERESIQTPTIFVARNLEHIYGVDVLIAAFHKVLPNYPKVRLMIAGSGYEEEALKQQCAQLGIKDAVTFTGQIENDQMALYYQKATVAVNPSRADNLPISILEAFAFKVPVVSTDVGGVPCIVDDERTGLLVPSDDASKMASAIKRILEDKTLANRLASEGRREVESYAWPAVKQKLMAVYSAVLS